MKCPSLEFLLEDPLRRTMHKYLSANFPDFTKYIENNSNILPKRWIEKLYWFYHKIDKYPVCECGKKVNFIDFRRGYRSFCSLKCSRNSKETINKLKKTNLEKYGVEWNSQSQSSKDKQRETNIKKYGCACSLWNNNVQQKAIFTKTERYHNPHYVNVDKRCQTNMERHGVSCYSQTDECQNKIYRTKKKNHSFGTSAIEKQFKKYLDKNKINYRYQYKSSSYPFCCDFYFPETYSYLEIQDTWLHGFHPFDEKNADDINTLDLWRSKNTKFYDEAIRTWTIRDVKKRKYAKINNLNWYEVFTNDFPDLLNKVLEFNIF